MNRRDPVSRWTVRRRGSLRLVLLVGVAALLGLLSIATDLALVQYAQQQLQTGCEAAALAGAAELLEPIPPGRSVALEGGKRPDQASVRPNTSAEWSQRVEAARRQAIAFAARNKVLGSPIEISADTGGFEHAERVDTFPDSATGEMAVGWIREPLSPQSEFFPWTGEGPVNAVCVRAARSRYRGNPISLWMAKTMGLMDANVLASACATMDRRVHGFRPAGHVNVPLVPLLLLDTEPNQPSLRMLVGRPGYNAPNGFGAGQVFKLRIRSKPGEGRLGSTTTPPSGGAVENQRENTQLVASFSAYRLTPDKRSVQPNALNRQITDGLGPSDLRSVGGQIALGDLRNYPTATSAYLESKTFRVVAEALRALRDRVRIWPLGGETAQRGTWAVSGFVAGRVVAVNRESEDCLTVSVQLCCLQTCTAVVKSGIPHNRWIGKLRLSR